MIGGVRVYYVYIYSYLGGIHVVKGGVHVAVPLILGDGSRLTRAALAVSSLASWQ